MNQPQAPHRLLVFAPSARSGGPIRYLQQLLPHLATHWHGPIILAAPRETITNHLTEYSSVTLLPLDRPPCLKGPLHVFASQIQAWRLCRRLRPHVVYHVGNTAYTGPFIPTVTQIDNAATLSDLRWPSIHTWLVTLLRRCLILLSAIRSHHLIAVSEFTRSILPMGIGRHKTVAIHHGCDDLQAQAPPSTSSHIQILAPGNLAPYRGTERAIRALTLIPSPQNTWRLTIIGKVVDTRYAQRCQQLASQLGISDNIDWHGPLPRNEFLAAMTNASLILITSRSEACPSILQEAAALSPSRPVLGFDDPWSHEYDALFDARRPESDLPETIATTLPTSPNRIQHHRNEYLKRTSWEASAQALTAVLTSLAECPGQ